MTKVSEGKVQRQVVDFFAFFEDCVVACEGSAERCRCTAQTLVELLRRYRFTRDASLFGTPLEDVRDTLLLKLDKLINKHIITLKEELTSLNEQQQKLSNKHSNIESSCKEIDFGDHSALVRGNHLQPPLSQLLEYAHDAINFTFQVCTQLDFSIEQLALDEADTDESIIDNFTINSILNSMQKPPSASEAQKNAMKKQKEAQEKRQRQEREALNKFRKNVEEKISAFVKDGKKPYLQFEPMEQTYRAIVRDVADIAGVQAFSFGQEGVDRYCIVYAKESGPSEDELNVRRAGQVWDEEKAADMVRKRQEMEKEAAAEAEEGRKRKRKPETLSGTFYKDKYAHLIGQDAALDAAHRTNVNKSYGEVPSENKKDQRSIEQTMADIQAKKRKKLEIETETHIDDSQ